MFPGKIVIIISNNIIRIFLVFFILSIFGCGEKRETIQAGVSIKNITPPLELNPILGGYGDRMSKPAIGVHDSIYAKAIVFKDDTKTFALVTTDMQSFPPYFKSQLVKEMQEFGWSEKNILLLPSHSHSSIEMMSLHSRNNLNIPQIGIYNNDVFIVQTPILYSPFGISTIYNIIDLSFQCNDITNDFINNCLSKFYITTKRKYTNYIIEDYIRQNKYSKWMRFKVTKGTIFYNQDRDKIHTFESKVLGSYIIELSGLWIINGKISFNWSILQAKIYEPFVLKEYSFFDDEDKEERVKRDVTINNVLPPPPPPPAPRAPPTRPGALPASGLPRSRVVRPSEPCH